MPRCSDSRSTERILLIGDSPDVLKARAQVLAEWMPIAVNSNQAKTLLKTQTFNAVLIGHTVADDTAKQIISDAKTLRSTESFLLIRTGKATAIPGVTIYVWNLYESPIWLQLAVASRLAHKVASAA